MHQWLSSTGTCCIILLRFSEINVRTPHLFHAGYMPLHLGLLHFITLITFSEAYTL
jgi:hypothetical protein